MKEVDPPYDIPSGREVLQKLLPAKKYSGPVMKHIITLFDHLAAAQSKSLMPATNISSLAKICDAETLDIIL